MLYMQPSKVYGAVQTAIVKKILSTCLVLFIITAPHNSFSQGVYQKFITAYNTSDFEECVKNGTLVTAQVEHPDLLIQLAECQCGLGRLPETVELLKRLAGKGILLPLDTMKAFKNLMASSEYKQKVKSRTAPKANGDKKVFELSERLFVPEGIAYDERNHRFFVGSLTQNKIITVTKDGAEEDFFSPEDGEWSFTGMKITGQDLWACAFSEHGPNAGKGALFRIDVSTGEKKDMLTLDEGVHLFNDLVITSSGIIYMTDSKSRLVYEIKDRTFRAMADSASFIYPNGIALDEKSNRLFVAHWMGISVIDLKSNKATPLTADATYLNSADGLYWRDNALVAIQNIKYSSRIAKLTIDGNNQVISSTVLFTRNGMPGFPTTGVFINRDFYFIENSYVTSVQPDGSIKEPEKVQPTYVKRISIR
jgi:hypothetical protein